MPQAPVLRTTGSCSASRPHIQVTGRKEVSELKVVSLGSLVFLRRKKCGTLASLPELSHMVIPGRKCLRKVSVYHFSLCEKGRQGEGCVGMGLSESRSCSHLEAALLLGMNGFHKPCSSLILFFWIYWVQGLGICVIEDPLLFVLLSPEYNREPYNPILLAIWNWTAYISIPNFCSIKFISISTSKNWFFFLIFFLPFVYSWKSWIQTQICIHHG